MEQFKCYLKMEEKKRPNWEWLTSHINSGCYWNVVYVVIVLLISIWMLKSCVGCISGTGDNVNHSTTSSNGWEDGSPKSRYTETHVEESEEAAFIGNYNIDNGLGKMVINEDNTVRITIQGKTYAGALENYALFGEDYYISLTEDIPLEWNYALFMGKYVEESTSSLYIDEQKQFLYFNHTALDAKDENKRWKITKINPNDNLTEYAQEENNEDYYIENLESDDDSYNKTYVYSISDDGFLNIREKPSDKSEILGILITGGEGAELLDNSSKWYKVKKGDVIGYVYSKYAFISPSVKNEAVP